MPQRGRFLVAELRTTLLPRDRHEPQQSAPVDYIYEEPPVEVLNDLLPRYVEMELYRALLESSASEHAARMTAMDAATRNAKDLIGSLQLSYNKARQAAITKEILEIVGGAEALAKG